MKLIDNPTPNFKSFKDEVLMRIKLLNIPTPDNKMIKAEWESRRAARFYQDESHQCIRRDRFESMPHYRNKVFADAIGDNVIWLAISRFDKQPMLWTHKQHIKNLVVGEDYEGVELYPRIDRSIPWTNEDHLWVLKTKGAFNPLGYADIIED